MIFHNGNLEMVPDNMQHDIYTTPLKDEAFLFHHSFFSTYQRLEGQEAQDYINAILVYAFYGLKPDENKSVWTHGLDTVFSQMDTDTWRDAP